MFDPLSAFAVSESGNISISLEKETCDRFGRCWAYVDFDESFQDNGFRSPQLCCPE